MANDYDLTQKQEDFCRYYVQNGNGSLSAEKAGYSKSGSGVTASRLLKNDKVKKFLAELRREAIADSNQDTEQIVQWLYDIANPANGEATGNRLKAIEQLGKVHGLFVDKKQIESHNTHDIYDFSNMSEEELQKAIEQFEEE